VAGTASFANGDGLCYIDANRELQGFRVNRAQGNRLFPQQMPRTLRPGMALYRNNDQEFERVLSRPSSSRKIPVNFSLTVIPEGFALSAEGCQVSIACEHQVAEKPQQENIQRQLSRLGGTPFECSGVDLPAGFNYFIPSSLLADLRRQWVEAVLGADTGSFCMSKMSGSPGLPSYAHGYLYNIANRDARAFYEAQGLKQIEPAFELLPPRHGLLMQCRHCLRYALGYCVKHGGHTPQWSEPLYLRLGDGRRFRLEFDCRHCQMNVYAE
jgi:putative protease